MMPELPRHACSLCLAPTANFGEALIRERHTARYRRCEACGFVQVASPTWLEEAYAEPINRTDLGLVGRNLSLSKITTAMIAAFFDPDARFLDYGAGTGLLVRLMRDNGLDFRYDDKYGPNLFAQGFEREEGQDFALVTAFELFEHLVDPLEEISRMLKFSKNLLFTTELLPEPAPAPGTWWYYGLEHGQHLSFYSRRSLSALAERFGLNLYTNGRSVHLLTEKRLFAPLFKALSRYPIATLAAMGRRRPSLLPADYAKSVAATRRSHADSL